MLHIPTMRLYQIEGNDIKNFLQGQVCADIEVLEKQPSILTTICNAKGRAIASVFLIKTKSNYYLAIDDAMYTILWDYWKPYCQLSRISLNKQTQLHCIACPTPNTALAADTEFVIDLPGQTKAQLIFCEKIPTNEVTTSKQQWYETLVAAGVIYITAALTAKLMPITLQYESFHGLSFKKGCYVGQEILARVHFKGKIKQQIKAISFTKPCQIQSAQAILNSNNNQQGMILMAPGSNLTTTLSLGLFPLNAEKEQWYIESNEKKIACNFLNE